MRNTSLIRRLLGAALALGMLACMPVPAAQADTVTGETAVSAPDWVPADGTSAAVFCDTYGVTHASDACAVCCVPLGEGEHYTASLADSEASSRILREEVLTGENGDFYLLSVEPQSVGTLDIVLTGTQTRHFTFYITQKEDGTMRTVQNDYLEHVPDCPAEAAGWYGKYGILSAPRFAIYCMPLYKGETDTLTVTGSYETLCDFMLTENPGSRTASDICYHIVAVSPTAEGTLEMEAQLTASDGTLLRKTQGSFTAYYEDEYILSADEDNRYYSNLPDTTREAIEFQSHYGHMYASGQKKIIYCMEGNAEYDLSGMTVSYEILSDTVIEGTPTYHVLAIQYSKGEGIFDVQWSRDGEPWYHYSYTSDRSGILTGGDPLLGLPDCHEEAVTFAERYGDIAVRPNGDIVVCCTQEDYTWSPACEFNRSVTGTASYEVVLDERIEHSPDGVGVGVAEPVPYDHIQAIRPTSTGILNVSWTLEYDGRTLWSASASYQVRETEKETPLGTTETVMEVVPYCHDADWVPVDPTGFRTFMNDYGKTLVRDGMICICDSKEPVITDDGTQYELLYDVKISGDNGSDCYVKLLRPTAAGAIRVQCGDGMLGEYTFEADADGTVRQTGITAIVPDGYNEAETFANINGTVSVHDGCIVYCDPNGVTSGHRYNPDSTSTATFEEQHETIYYQAEPGYYGSVSYYLDVLRPLTPGDVTLTWDFGRFAPSFNTDTIDHTDTAAFTITEDLQVLTPEGLPAGVPDTYEKSVDFLNRHGHVLVEGQYVTFCIDWNEEPGIAHLERDNGSTAEYTFVSRETYKMEGLADGWYHEVITLRVDSPGTIDLSWLEDYSLIYGEEPDEERYHYTFEADDALQLTQTDIYAFVPDSYYEVQAMRRKPENAFAQDGRIIFCADNTAGERYAIAQQLGNSGYRVDAYQSAVYQSADDPTPVASYAVQVLTPTAPGILTLSWINERESADAPEPFTCEHTFLVTQTLEVIDITDVVLGDVDGNGVVNANDAARILTAAARIGAKRDSGLAGQAVYAADVNGSGSINAIDAASVLRYAASVGARHENVRIEQYI